MNEKVYLFFKIYRNDVFSGFSRSIDFNINEYQIYNLTMINITLKKRNLKLKEKKK